MEPTIVSLQQTAARLSAELRFVQIPVEYTRPPEMVAKLMELGMALLPGARLDVAEQLAVLYIFAARGECELTQRDVERFKQDAIRDGCVRSAKAA